MNSNEISAYNDDRNFNRNNSHSTYSITSNVSCSNYNYMQKYPSYNNISLLMPRPPQSHSFVNNNDINNNNNSNVNSNIITPNINNYTPTTIIHSYQHHALNKTSLLNNLPKPTYINTSTTFPYQHQQQQHNLSNILESNLDKTRKILSLRSPSSDLFTDNSPSSTSITHPLNPSTPSKPHTTDRIFYQTTFNNTTKPTSLKKQNLPITTQHLNQHQHQPPVTHLFRIPIQTHLHQNDISSTMTTSPELDLSFTHVKRTTMSNIIRHNPLTKTKAKIKEQVTTPSLSYSSNNNNNMNSFNTNNTSYQCYVSSSNNNSHLHSRSLCKRNSHKPVMIRNKPKINELLVKIDYLNKVLNSNKQELSRSKSEIERLRKENEERIETMNNNKKEVTQLKNQSFNLQIVSVVPKNMKHSYDGKMLRQIKEIQITKMPSTTTHTNGVNNNNCNNNKSSPSFISSSTTTYHTSSIKKHPNAHLISKLNLKKSFNNIIPNTTTNNNKIILTNKTFNPNTTCFTIYNTNTFLTFDTISKQLTFLPFTNDPHSTIPFAYTPSCMSLQLKNTLYIITGDNHDMLYKYTPTTNTITYLTKLNSNHHLGGFIYFPKHDKLICLSGAYNKTIETYDISSRLCKWIVHKKEMNIERSESSYAIINNTYIIAVYGYNCPTNKYINSIEINTNINNVDSAWKYINNVSCYNKDNNIPLLLRGHIMIGIDNGKESDCGSYRFVIVGGYNGAVNKPQDKYVEFVFVKEKGMFNVVLCEINRKIFGIAKYKEYMFEYTNSGVRNVNKDDVYVFDKEWRMHYLNKHTLLHDVFVLSGGEN